MVQHYILHYRFEYWGSNDFQNIVLQWFAETRTVRVIRITYIRTNDTLNAHRLGIINRIPVLCFWIIYYLMCRYVLALSTVHLSRYVDFGLEIMYVQRVFRVSKVAFDKRVLIIILWCILLCTHRQLAP